MNPENAKRSIDREPLKTLKTFRQVKGKDRQFLNIYRDDPVVGVNVVIIKTGKIQVGDEIVLKST